MVITERKLMLLTSHWVDKKVRISHFIADNYLGLGIYHLGRIGSYPLKGPFAEDMVMKQIYPPEEKRGIQGVGTGQDSEIIAAKTLFMEEGQVDYMHREYVKTEMERLRNTYGGIPIELRDSEIDGEKLGVAAMFPANQLENILNKEFMDTQINKKNK